MIKNRKNIALDLCYDGILIALVFVATMFVRIPAPAGVGGIIHMGNVPLVVASIAFGKRRGAVAGAFGMALFDLLSGWVMWAPFTFVTRGVMGYVIGLISEQKRGESLALNFIAVVTGGIIMMVGMYFAEVIILSSFVIPIGSIPGNVTQTVIAVVLGIPLAMLIKKQRMFRREV